MRCPDCNKFVSMSAEVEDVDVNLEDSGKELQATASVVRSCDECRQEMKRADFEMVQEIGDQFPDCFDDNGKLKDGHELEVEEYSEDLIEEGGGRYAKSYFGVSLEVTVKCECDHSVVVTLKDKVAASAMDEMV